MNTSQKSSTTHLHIWAAGRRVEQSRDAAFHLETEHHTCREKLVQSLLLLLNASEVPWQPRSNTHLSFCFVFSSGISLTSSSPPVHPALLSASGDWTGTQTFDSGSVGVQNDFIFKEFSEDFKKLKKYIYCKIMSLTTPASSRNCIILSSSTRPEKWTLTLWTSLTQSTKCFSR